MMLQNRKTTPLRLYLSLYRPKASNRGAKATLAVSCGWHAESLQNSDRAILESQYRHHREDGMGSLRSYSVLLEPRRRRASRLHYTQPSETYASSSRRKLIRCEATPVPVARGNQALCETAVSVPGGIARSFSLGCAVMDVIRGDGPLSRANLRPRL